MFRSYLHPPRNQWSPCHCTDTLAGKAAWPFRMQPRGRSHGLSPFVFTQGLQSNLINGHQTPFQAAILNQDKPPAHWASAQWKSRALEFASKWGHAKGLALQRPQAACLCPAWFLADRNDRTETMLISFGSGFGPVCCKACDILCPPS